MLNQKSIFQEYIEMNHFQNKNKNENKIFE